MFDLAASDPRHQRVKGRAAVTFGEGGRLSGLAQSGSAKAMLPKMHGRAPEVVFLNTAGGLTGGDWLDYAVELRGGTAVATTQTAERAYRSAGGSARVRTRLSLGPGATLHWLPQELILFEGASLERTLEVDMASDARFVMLETLVLGRAAMGETLARLRLRDRRRVTRAGRPVLIEGAFLDDADLARAGAAGLDRAVAVASLSLLSGDAGDRLGAIRAALPGGDEVRAAASAWDGRLTVRFMARDAWPLRRAVARAVAALTGTPLPRVWQI
ncbi:urease accessory protein UreD [Roseibacterium sp. SDUM158017]|uniref:urease accessory protein UreD n=1 Tax=Roseicyclus salinarum TaxID=3036773 RepID=UPI0024155E49|nr:urease accessory protein UreD [Roseibacterium sp. SDUM158017]MDG4650025.1 urease accessory protein UreD [Roseibacterium sp. SDUM158017]